MTPEVQFAVLVNHPIVCLRPSDMGLGVGRFSGAVEGALKVGLSCAKQPGLQRLSPRMLFDIQNRPT